MKELFTPTNRCMSGMDGHRLFVSDDGKFYLCQGDKSTPDTSPDGRCRILFKSLSKNGQGPHSPVVVAFQNGRLVFCVLVQDEKTGKVRQLQTTLETMRAIQEHCPMRLQYMSYIASAMRRVRTLEALGADVWARDAGAKKWNDIRPVRDELDSMGVRINEHYSVTVLGAAVSLMCPENMLEMVRSVFDAHKITIAHFCTLPPIDESLRPRPPVVSQDGDCDWFSREKKAQPIDLISPSELFGSVGKDAPLSAIVPKGTGCEAPSFPGDEIEQQGRDLPVLEFSPGELIS